MIEKQENLSLDFLKQICILAALWVVSLSFGSLLVGILSQGIFQIPDLQKFMEEIQAGEHSDYKNILRFLLSISHIFTFIVPVLFFNWLYWRTNLINSLYLNRTFEAKKFGVHFLLVLLSLPLANFLYALNVEFMGNPEPSAAELLTKTITQMSSPTDLFMNIWLIGICAGVGEELLFRGVLQRIVAVRFQNIHAAVWITAVIFSLIHFDMQGFLPRFALGAVLGYVFVWSGNLWFSIILHILYNSSQVVAIYLQPELANQAKPSLEPLLIGSVVVGSGLLYLVVRWLDKNSEKTYLPNNNFLQNPYSIDKTV